MKLSNAAQEHITHHAVTGSFGAVKYFLTTLDLRDAAENLQLLPQDNLSFKERIQRVLNEDRVRDEILPYLLEDEDRFFNSLVCILLPDENQSEGYWSFTPYTDEAGAEIKNLGSFKIAKRVARVVLDGQHRYRALSLYWDKVRGELEGMRQKIDVPVVYVVVDSLGQVGHRATNYRAKTTEVVRRLFAVLNKNAKLVDRTTLLLIDDSDITNLISRRLIEEEIVKESLVKWYAGDSLNPGDPYFTSLHTIRDMVRGFLDNYRSDWESTEVLTQRDRMLAKLYGEGVFPTFSLREAIKLIFANWKCYADWCDLLGKEQIEVPQQPEEPVLKAGQKQRLTNVRKNSLCFTVAGQRAMLSGLAKTFLTGTSQSKTTLQTLITKLNLLYEHGVFSRKTSREAPNIFYSVLFDAKGRMIYSRNYVDLAGKIIAVTLGAKMDRQTVALEFNGLTNLDSELVHAHWKRCDQLFERNLGQAEPVKA